MLLHNDLLGCNYCDASSPHNAMHSSSINYIFPLCALVTPRKADFLYIYSTTDGCVAYGQKQTGFISKLVDNLILKFNDKHLEDVLLDVKKEVASENYCEDGMYFKQMPSVVSQMRDRVWFAKY